MRIKEVEELVGITRKNIRFYEKEGLLNPGRELENSYRDYSEEDIRRLWIIKLLRKLDMPINSISDVLEGRISLQEAAHLQSLLLEEHRISVLAAQGICRELEAQGLTLADLDPEEFLAAIRKNEENGTELVNLRKADTPKDKYREAVVAAAVIGGILLIAACVLVFFSHLSDANIRYFAAIPVLIFFGRVWALVTRIKEIKGGEENDLDHY